MSEIVPTELETVPEGETRFHRTISVVVGLVAVLASLLAILEADSHRRNGVASAASARLSSDIFAKTAASTPYFSFRLSSLQDAAGLGLQSAARRLAIFRHPSVRPAETARARAEETASKRAVAVVAAMGRLPTEEDGVDEYTRETMGASLAEDRELVREQNEEVERAERYASRETRAILGLSLAASAAALLGLAGLLGGTRPGRLLLVVALLAITGAIAAGAAALTL